MIEIRCTRENVREELRRHFPNPTPAHNMAISRVIEALSYPSKVTGVFAQGYRSIPLDVEIQIETGSGYPDASFDEAKWLSESQAAVPVSEQEDDAWRATDEAARTSGQEEHAARRHAPVTAYARTVGDPAMIERQRALYAEGIKLTPLTKNDFLAAVGMEPDNANTGEVGTFTDGPEERYTAIFGMAGGTSRVYDRQRSSVRPVCWGSNFEDMQLIADALNAWEASQ